MELTIEYLTEMCNNIDSLLPRLGKYIQQFNSEANIADVLPGIADAGNIFVDSPVNMSDADATKIANRLDILHNIIKTTGSEIKELFSQAKTIESSIKPNVGISSRITSQATAFESLKSSYKH
jgi:hypothetical protein